MTTPGFRFPATPEGRQLLKDMLRGARMDSVTPDFDFESCDFDNLAAEMFGDEGYAVYIDYLEGRDPSDLNPEEKGDLAEWRKKYPDGFHQEREGSGK